MKRSLSPRIWTFANKVVKCALRFFLWRRCQRTSCWCRLVWSCAGGTLFGHMVSPFSLSTFLSLSLPRFCPPTLWSERFTCLARNSLPLIFYFSFFFDRCLRFFGPSTGLPTRLRLVTLPRIVVARLFPRIEADEPFFLRSVIIP